MAQLPEYTSIEEKMKVFAKYRRIDNVTDLDAWYEGMKGRDVFYRGMKEARYKNFTSAQRACIVNDFKCLPSTCVQILLSHLKNVYSNLLTKYCQSEGIALTDFYLMSFAQHHSPGISLLLDVTPNINTALFFMKGEKVAGINTNNLNDYASIYIFQRPSISLDDITNEISSLIEFSDSERTFKQFVTRCNCATHRLCSISNFSILLQKKYFLIENRHYHISYNFKDYSYQDNIMVTNLNIVAQDGCFLFCNYDNLFPLEQEIDECVDIHKSLIPYISRKFLIPNHKTKKELFPDNNKIVKIAYDKILKDSELKKECCRIEFMIPHMQEFTLYDKQQTFHVK